MPGLRVIPKIPANVKLPLPGLKVRLISSVWFHIIVFLVNEFKSVGRVIFNYALKETIAELDLFVNYPFS